MVQSSTRTNPFPGLRPFELDEEHLFFGREGQADELLTRLHRTRFLAVVGTSGSGKSSLVRAGLLPSLYSGFLPAASSGWRVAILRPGSAPMANLAAALNAPEVFGVDPTSDDAVIRTALTESTLRRGSLGLVEVAQQARMKPHENLLVVVDQFEELFRFKAQATQKLAAENEAAAFVKLLLGAVEQRQVPIYVVLTMRSDFLGDCAQFRDLPETLNDSQYLIPRLTRGQLKAAIEGPVAVGGATIAPRLVNRLLNDTGDNPDQLPILQHALMRTWDHWEDQNQPQTSIDMEHYEAIGGMAQALSRHADQVYLGLPDDRARQIAESLFRRLTDRGADNREIRRPTQLAELSAVANASEAEVIAVIDEFRGARRSFVMPPLPLPLDGPSVIDISHESLMRNWGRLKGWVEAETQSATIYRRLAETVEMYDQGRAGFLRDPELTIGLTWRDEQQPNGVWAERYAPNFDEALAFLDASAQAAEAEATEKERARKREVNRLRGFLALLGGLSLLTGGAAVYAFSQQQEAKTQTVFAEEQRQAAETQTAKAQAQEKIALDEKARADNQRKLAERAQKEAEAQKQQAEAAQAAEAEQRQQAQAASQRAEAGEAEAQQQATIAQEQTAIAEQQTSLAEENESKAIEATRSAEIQALNANIQTESFRVENLMASSLNLKALLAALELGRQIKGFDEGGESLEQAAQAKAVGKAAVQNVSSANNPVRPSIRQQAISVLREAYFFDGYTERNTLAGHSAGVNGVSFSPDGETIASASDDETVKLWNRQGEELQTLAGHSGGVYGVSFSPDGETIASASRDGTVKLWNRQGKELQTLAGHSAAVYAVSFSPDGETIASASLDKTIILWNLNLDDLMAKSCDWLQDYMANPATPAEEKALCEGYLPPQLLSSIGPLHLVASVRAFLGAVLKSG